MGGAGTNRNEIDRRSFLKCGTVGAAAGLGAAVMGTSVGAKESRTPIAVRRIDEFPNRITGTYKRFDHKYTAFSRGFWDPALQEIMTKFSSVPTRDQPGMTELDRALFAAGWALEDRFGEWSKLGQPDTEAYQWRNWKNPEKYEFDNPVEASKKVKRAARFLGASLVGIARYNPLWTYASILRINKFKASNPVQWPRNPGGFESVEPEFPFEPKSVVVMAVAEDYQAIGCTPSFISTGASGKGYSEMAALGWSVMRFLSELGYQSLANGNDTTLSVPYAVAAGLGEASRIGVVLTPEYGPRVRLVKVLTELELQPDKPIEFGAAEFCRTCKRCAESCPSEAIPFGDQTLEGPTISNNPGVEKWYSNPEKCFGFWADNGSYGCANCIAACPYNKTEMWNHRMIARFTELPGDNLHNLMARMDKLFGYGNTFDLRANDQWWEG